MGPGGVPSHPKLPSNLFLKMTQTTEKCRELLSHWNVKMLFVQVRNLSLKIIYRNCTEVMITFSTNYEGKHVTEIHGWGWAQSTLFKKRTQTLLFWDWETLISWIRLTLKIWTLLRGENAKPPAWTNGGPVEFRERWANRASSKMSGRKEAIWSSQALRVSQNEKIITLNWSLNLSARPKQKFGSGRISPRLTASFHRMIEKPTMRKIVWSFV